jgi:hypothetical protein
MFVIRMIMTAVVAGRSHHGLFLFFFRFAIGCAVAVKATVKTNHPAVSIEVKGFTVVSGFKFLHEYYPLMQTSPYIARRKSLPREALPMMPT